jgi:hypothetical protein
MTSCQLTNHSRFGYPLRSLPPMFSTKPFCPVPPGLTCTGPKFWSRSIQAAKHLERSISGKLVMHEVIGPHSFGHCGTEMRMSMQQPRFVGRRFGRFNPNLLQSRQTPLTFVSVITAMQRSRRRGYLQVCLEASLMRRKETAQSVGKFYMWRATLKVVFCNLLILKGNISMAQ